MGGLKGANRYSFTGKPRDKGSYGESTPGPAHYDKMRSSLGGVKFSFGAKPLDIPGGNHVPGPGKYNVDEAFNKSKSKVSYSLTGRPPPQVIGDDLPGPGQYSVVEAYAKSQASNGPSYSIYGKHRRVEINDIPGPAAYFHQPKPGGVSFTFKGKYLQPGDTEDGPGPGKYYKELKQTVGPQWSLAKRYPQFDTTFAYTELAQKLMLKQYNSAVKEPLPPRTTAT
eukprot:CAMPEP_0175140902 /NCGR_PEP_ID=MMETSP0087-20121206/11781_1 /TAXON_ID=136419 /ORGANISM="Unknown Unknown, Strain D1" /LENGTH=224 /DNA_ID=CAMNT_0016424205 /DNA_START=88 /DNA_END=762 /DNA_ORIENTATION=+